MSLGFSAIGRTAIAASEVVAAVVTSTGWWSKYPEPANLNSRRAAIAAALAAAVVWTPQVIVQPIQNFTGATSPDWVTGIPTRSKGLSTAARDTTWMPRMPPRVPDREFQEG